MCIVYIPLANLGGLSKRFFLSHCVDDAMIDIQAVLWASLLATVKEIQIQRYATIFFVQGRAIYTVLMHHIFIIMLKSKMLIFFDNSR